MKTVAMVTPVTYQIRSHVLGFWAPAWKDNAQYSCNEIWVVQVASQALTGLP